MLKVKKQNRLIAKAVKKDGFIDRDVYLDKGRRGWDGSNLLLIFTHVIALNPGR